MSAAVLAFPVLVAAPVAQVRRRGRLPAGVRSLPAHRVECDRRVKEAAAANVKKMEALCINTLIRLARGEVSGLAIIEARKDEPERVFASGQFVIDYDYLQRCIHAFGDLVADSWMKEAKS